MNTITSLSLVIDILVCLVSAHGIYGLRRAMGEIWPKYRNAMSTAIMFVSGFAIYGSNWVISAIGS